MILTHQCDIFVISCLIFSVGIVFCAEQKNPFDEAESELTVTVLPGEMDCFFQKVKRDDSLEIEYQVTDASFGELELQRDLDINFQLISPTNKELISDYKKSDAMHRHEAKETGDYKICFDNRYSQFTKKTVYFEVYIDSTDDDYGWDDFSFPPEMLYNDTMDQIKNSISKVHEDLNKIKHHQDQVKAIESRDRNLQEHNFTRVNQFSMLFVIVMLIVGAVQVAMVRSLFEEKSKLHKIFQLLS